jgi:hypothetical protein
MIKMYQGKITITSIQNKIKNFNLNKTVKRLIQFWEFNINLSSQMNKINKATNITKKTFYSPKKIIPKLIKIKTIIKTQI